MEHYNYELPLPPSVNHSYITTRQGKRVATPEKRAWSDAVAAILPPVPLTRRKGKYQLRVFLRIYLSNWRSDIDNYTKNAIDATTRALGLDDRYITLLEVSRHTVLPGEQRAEIDVYVNDRD